MAVCGTLLPKIGSGETGLPSASLASTFVGIMVTGAPAPGRVRIPRNRYIFFFFGRGREPPGSDPATGYVSAYGRMPPPRLPTPTGVYLPRSRVWGGPEERAGAWVSSPGYGPPRVSSRLPPPPRGGGGGQGPGGVGDAGILKPGRREGDLTKPGYYLHFV
jgi:hypothetical protein